MSRCYLSESPPADIVPAAPVADYIGRTYGPSVYLPTNHWRVTALSLARTIFIPLFLACNTVVNGQSASHVPWIDSDIGYFLVVFAFGCSNGCVFVQRWSGGLALIPLCNTGTSPPYQ